MAEYTVITRKIEVHLHSDDNSEESKELLQEKYRAWNEINDHLYEAANRIVSHCFFNDEYGMRLRVNSPRYRDIKKILRKAQKNKLDESYVRELKTERKQLDKEFDKQRLTFLRGGIPDGKGSEQNSTYHVATNEFLDSIPSNILTCLNQNIIKTYNSYKTEIKFGERTIPNFKKGLPVPFPIKHNGKLRIRKRDDGTIFVKFPKNEEQKWYLEWDLDFGRDRSNNREIVERILNGTYDVGDSSIQETRSRKRFLLLVVKIPKEQNVSLDPNRVAGIDLGINIPLYAALNDNEYARSRIGSRDKFLDVRKRMEAQLHELQANLRNSTAGGRGRGHKLQALERFKEKERNWVRLQNHIFSKGAIEFAVKNNAGVIQMERLTGFGRDGNGEVKDNRKFLLRNWSYFELQQLIEYKAHAAGIEVRYVDPYHTSQICSFCGHYEPDQRSDQPHFICKNPECEKGKGKKLKDGSYKGINADWNAARNIAKSEKIVDRRKNTKK